MLTNLIMDRFVMFPASTHLPRISIDRLVIARETWRFPAGQLEFAATADEAVRFAAARAWWRGASLPEQVFVKVPGETKPFFVDFTSPHYVAILAKAVRRLRAAGPGQAAEAIVQISEMLPSMDDLWLSDREGNRYTSECRVVAVDRRGPLPGGGPAR